MARPEGAGHSSRRDAASWQALQRRRRRRRRRQAAAWFVLLGITLGLGIGLDWSRRTSLAWIRTHTSLLQIREVNATETRWMPQWEVVEASGLAPGEDILEAPVEDARLRVEAHPRVRRAVVHRRWTGSILVEVEERRPLAVLLDGDRALELGAGGVVLGLPPGPQPEYRPGRDFRGVSLPVIAGLGPNRAEPGDVIDHRGLRRALGFLALTDHYGFPPSAWISEITVSDPDSIVLYLFDGGIPVRVGNGRVSRKQLLALFAALENLKEQGIRARSIDLRFVNQIVVKEG